MKNNMSKLVLFFLLAFVAGFLASLKLQISWQKSQTVLTINNQLIQVEVAKTDEEITNGLSGREKLEENKGMLFVFAKTGKYQFWMKEMRFDLDAIFINGETIVDIVENISAPKNNEQPQVFQAKIDFDKVLEVNNGTIKRLNIKIGDEVKE